MYPTAQKKCPSFIGEIMPVHEPMAIIHKYLPILWNA